MSLWKRGREWDEKNKKLCKEVADTSAMVSVIAVSAFRCVDYSVFFIVVVTSPRSQMG